MSCYTIFKMHDVYSVCFVITDLRSLTITCNIYTHVLQMSCMWIKDGFHFNSGHFSGLPTELPTISILERSGVSIKLATELPTISVYESSWSLIYIAKFPWAAHGQPTPLPTELPTFSYLEVVSSLICMAKFLWTAHGQPTPLPTELPTF